MTHWLLRAGVGSVIVSGEFPHISNNALLGGGVRVWIREQIKIKRRSKAHLLSL